MRNPAERMGQCCNGAADTSIKKFNDWIDELEVEDAPWVGKNFTWFRPNGSAKSKLDRFLISHEWMAKWPDTTQYTLERNFSDHCPILLRSKIIDWGPKPFRVMDYWLKDSSFTKTVHECWTSTQIGGWGGYVLKEKLKRLKRRLQIWNKEEFGDTYKKYKQIQGELNRLEEQTIDRFLSPQEANVRRQLQQQLWTAALSHESLLRQKSRAR